jgi:hypothetical protein
MIIMMMMMMIIIIIIIIIKISHFMVFRKIISVHSESQVKSVKKPHG